MIGKTFAATLVGVDAELIHIEVDTVPSQLPGFTIVGLPGKAVQEAKERIIAAIKNSGFNWPRKKIIVNLAPADIPKSGTSFDLPIAIAILHASGQITFNPANFLFIGELSLDGKLRHINGALSVALEAVKRSITHIIVPNEDAAEAGLVHEIYTIGAETLQDVAAYITCAKEPKFTQTEFADQLQKREFDIDFANICGQNEAKRAAIIAASGGHNILLRGTPGSGKTMLSRAIASILPDLTFAEALEITKIHSVANLLDANKGIIGKRPFRAPHHTASPISIIGGGSFPRPGELSLAHRGILFLDEFPEFSPYTLEALRQPLEEKKVVVSRISGTITFPANFMLVAAMNPCKCGWRGDPEKECTCTPLIIEKYMKRISGPILDRIDLQVNVPRVRVKELANSGSPASASSRDVVGIVQHCRDIQLDRFKGKKIFSNSEISQRDIEKFCCVEPLGKTLLLSAVEKLHLSARSYFRLVKIARTIADLDESDMILKRHIAESIQYRIVE